MSVLTQVIWCSQILTEVDLENTGVKPVTSVAMHQRRQQLKCSVSINWLLLDASNVKTVMRMPLFINTTGHLSDENRNVK